MSKTKIDNSSLEFTFLAIIVGIIIGVVMTAANVYLGLYAGMTVSASIPASVIAIGVFRGILRKNSILQCNIVQTMASAGESLAAGIIFTIPALVIVGAWQGFKFWPTTLIAISGGLLGVVFMIPLRKALIVKDKDLIYPEGVACAAVLEAGSLHEGSMFAILKGFFIGALFKFLATGMKLIQGSVEKAYSLFDRIWFVGSDISPALMAVGYIVKLEVAIMVFLGGTIGWFIGIPLLGLEGELVNATPLDAAWTMWSSKIRYLGVGAMISGGIWSIISVRRGIVSGLKELQNVYKTGKDKKVERVNQNMSITKMFLLFIASLIIVFFLYNHLIGSFGYTVLTTFIMILSSFLFVAVSSYIVGLVGSSNNPVSGMTISALLGTAALFLVLGFKGNSAILATLGVAAVVCCAACTAGDCSQDLKTGLLVSATPKYQQYAQVIGVLIPAFVIAPVLTLLHNAYGIGTGLKAPQATLFANITKALFGDANLPYSIVIYGVILGVVVIILDLILKKMKFKLRLHVMPLAVGIYLPITLAVPMLFGGIIRYYVDRLNTRKNDRPLETDTGVLLGSGLIAGEAVMGVILAIFIVCNVNLSVSWLSTFASEIISILSLTFVGYYIFSKAKQ